MKGHKQAVTVIVALIVIVAIGAGAINHFNKVNDTVPQVVNPQNEMESYFRAVPYNADKYLSDDEFVIAGGVRMGMTFEDVVEIIGDDFEVIENAPGVKSILKDGYHFGFYQIDGTFENQNVYHCLNHNLTVK